MLIVAVSYDAQSLNQRMETLQKAGHAVVPASSRRSAVNALQTGHYDLLLVGATVPSHDRLHLAKLSKERHPAAKIMLVGAEAESRALADCSVAPGDENELVQRVGELSTIVQRKELDLESALHRPKRALSAFMIMGKYPGWSCSLCGKIFRLTEDERLERADYDSAPTSRVLEDFHYHDCSEHA